MQGGKEQDWGYLVQMHRLEGRYDNVKVSEPPRKGQNARERGKREVALGFGETMPWDLGKWSHFLPNVEEDPPRVGPDLQTQKWFCRKRSDHEKRGQHGA